MSLIGDNPEDQATLAAVLLLIDTGTLDTLVYVAEDGSELPEVGRGASSTPA